MPSNVSLRCRVDCKGVFVIRSPLFLSCVRIDLIVVCAGTGRDLFNYCIISRAGLNPRAILVKTGFTASAANAEKLNAQLKQNSESAGMKSSGRL